MSMPGEQVDQFQRIGTEKQQVQKSRVDRIVPACLCSDHSRAGDGGRHPVEPILTPHSALSHPIHSPSFPVRM